MTSFDELKARLHRDFSFRADRVLPSLRDLERIARDNVVVDCYLKTWLNGHATLEQVLVAMCCELARHNAQMMKAQQLPIPKDAMADADFKIQILREAAELERMQ